MKSRVFALTLAALAVSTLPSLAAPTPAAIIMADYQAKIRPGLEKLNTTLTKQASAVAAQFISQGDTASAEEVTAQIKQKIAGEPILRPHPSLATLLAQYDGARETVLKPHQAAAVAKIEAALKSSAGKDMALVTELGKVREEIDAGKVASTTITAVTSPKAFLKQNKVPKKWGYYVSSKYDKRYGTLYLNEDGTISIDAASPGTGTWQPTSNPSVLMVDIKNTANDATTAAEKTEIVLAGNEATMKRVSGMRYLKAD